MKKRNGGGETGLIAPPDLTEAQLDSLRWLKADSIVSQMSEDERLGMLLMPSVYARSDKSSLAGVVKYGRDFHVGGLILLKGDTLSARMIADTLHKIGRSDIWIAIDAEWGLGMRLKDATTYPFNSEIGQRATKHAMRTYGLSVGEEARRLGINMVLGPVADVVPEGEVSFMRKRSLGGDVQRVAELVTAYSEGLEAAGVASVAKHFPGHGGVVTDTHKGLGIINKSLNEMQHTDLVPFQRYINAGMTGIMTGHLAFPAIDTVLVSASVSSSVMIDLLRNDMGFKGLVLTDALNMKGAGRATAADAVIAGADMVLSPESTPRALAELHEAMKTGRLTQKMLNDRVRRIIYFRMKMLN